MTGRRLYDQYVNELAAQASWVAVHGRGHRTVSPPAWPFLSSAEQDLWNGLAKRIRPRGKRS